MGFGRTRERLVAAGASACVLATLIGLSSAGCGKSASGKAITASEWAYFASSDAAGHVTQRRADTLAAEDLPELGATLALWTDAAGKHVSLASAPARTDRWPARTSSISSWPEWTAAPCRR
jgi:hypothetical protein